MMIAKEAYENLTNAIVERVVRDWEMVISDYPVQNYEGAPMTREDIRLFARDQWISDADVNAILDKIEKVYTEKFRPYVKDHWKEILEDWEHIRQATSSTEYARRMKEYRHICPMCGGKLKPMNGMWDRKARKTLREPYITCSYCELNMRYDDGRKKRNAVHGD